MSTPEDKRHTIERLVEVLEEAVYAVIESFPSEKERTCRACDTTFPQDAESHGGGCFVPKARAAIKEAKP